MGKYDCVLNRRIELVSHDRERIVFAFDDGARAVYVANAECCSESWIENVEFESSAKGSIIIKVNELPAFQKADAYETCDADDIKCYQVVFVTDKGRISVEFRNASNGFYGGWLELDTEQTTARAIV